MAAGWVALVDDSLPRVLVVEDEAAFVDALSVGLQREGFLVTVACDGEEGLHQFDSVHPDLVLIPMSCRSAMSASTSLATRSGFEMSSSICP